jgi:hypothetical protein
MFVTQQEVKTITGKIATADLIQRAQYVIEAYVGKFEADVSDTNDIEILKRATAYQTAYMLNNEDIVFEQMAVQTTGQNDAYTSFKQNDAASPFVAPMAVMVCNRLTFMRSRSIYTGKSSQLTASSDWRTV